MLAAPQLGFNDFLNRVEAMEAMDFEADGKMARQGRMTERDITRLKVRR